MRSMTGYGRGQSTCNGTKFSVELNSVNRKQSDVTVNLPRELAELEPRVRDLINSRIARGRLNVAIAYHTPSSTSAKLSLNTSLARAYFRAMQDLQEQLKAPGEIRIETVLGAPGVLQTPEEQLSPEDAWSYVEGALNDALEDLIKMREREGKHLAKDLIKRLKLVRQSLRKIQQLHPAVIRKYRTSL